MKNLSASIFSIFFFCLVPSASNSLTGAGTGAAEESSNLESLFYDDSGSTNKAYFQLNSEAEILSFEFAEDVAVGPAFIDATNHTVVVQVFDGEDLTNLTPSIALSDNASVSPATGVMWDFSNQVTYTVTTEDGSTQEWFITVEVNLLGNYVYYPFTGNDEDASGNNLNGSSPPGGLSTPTLVTDRNGTSNSAYSFDGNNDVIELSSGILNGSLQGTLAAWVNFSNISGGNSSFRTIIGKGSDTNSQFGLFAYNSKFVFEAYRDGAGQFLEVTYDFVNAGLDFLTGAKFI